MRTEGKRKALARGVSLALLLLAALTTRGQGIIYATPPQPTYYSLFYPGTLDFNLDINGDSTTDFILRSNDPDTSVNNAVLIAQGGNQIVTQNSYVAALGAGETIGSSLNPAYQWLSGKVPIATAAGIVGGSGYAEDGNFVGLSSAYIGFDIVDGGNNYYGWMSVSSPINDARAFTANAV